MGSSGRRERRRASKRKFVDNQHTLKRTEMNDPEASSAASQQPTTPAPPAPTLPKPTSASAEKIELDSDELNINADDCYVLVNTSILKQLVKLIGRCPKCKCTRKRSVKFQHHIEKKRELASNFSFSCENCSWEHSTYSSK